MPKQIPYEDAEAKARAIAVKFFHCPPEGLSPSLWERGSVPVLQPSCASAPGYYASVGSKDLITVTCTIKLEQSKHFCLTEVQQIALR